MKKGLNQSGVIHTIPLLLLVATIGVISFLLLSFVAPFSKGLFKYLNPKNSSKAAGAPVQCSSALHDSYKTTGPDGRSYPTWHPAVQPTGPEAGCVFGHEHGENPLDPNLQVANNTPPAFGYIGSVAGADEPHAGFKVAVAKHGTCTNSGDVLFLGDYRIVFHMGTSGVKRYTTPLHSVQFDYKGFNVPPTCGMPGGNMSNMEVHAQGMADTGPTNRNGSVCNVPRKGAKDFSTIQQSDLPPTFGSPPADCAKEGSPESAYEIWNGASLFLCASTDACSELTSRVALLFSMAVQDPILTRDARDNNRVLYTQDVIMPGSGIAGTSIDASFQGCLRDTYFGPVYMRNTDGLLPREFYTTVTGNGAQATQDAAHPLRQFVSCASNDDTQQLAIEVNNCVYGIRSPN